MNTTTKSILAVSAVVIGTAIAVPAFADKDDNDCDRWSKKYSMMKGDHYMGGMYGGHPGKHRFFRDDLNLSVEDVKNILEGRLAWQGNKNLKVGEVKAKDKDVVLAQIVTKDGSLVQQLEIDRNTGRPRSVK